MHARLACFFILFCSTSVLAQIQKGYHLFKPAPRDIIRTFSIDRPDITESAITVDAGHFQFEGDMLKWTSDRSMANSSTSLTFVSGLYKLGLTHSWDIHIGIEPYNKYYDIYGENYKSGYGATLVRLKHNFWGNDQNTKTNFGIIPYVNFLSGNPLDSKVVFGAGFPFAYIINEKLELGLQPQVDFVPVGNGHSMSFFQTVVLGGPIIGKLDFYFEGLVVVPPQSDTQFLLDGGLIYNVSPNVKIDVAANVGLNEAAPTRVYLGLSFRI